jgi:hypothetical protein
MLEIRFPNGQTDALLVDAFSAQPAVGDHRSQRKSNFVSRSKESLRIYLGTTQPHHCGGADRFLAAS